MQTLAERLAEPDMAALTDWEAAAKLNQPDNTLPAVVTWTQTEIGVGTVLDVLGPSAGAALLDTLAASSDSVLRWGMKIIESSRLDLSKPTARAQLDALVTAGALTADQRDAMFAVSKRERYPSWAEANNTPVDARAVGLARGGQP